MMKKITALLALILILAISSCDVESSASGYQVYFACDMAYHPYNHISSFGQFITVKRKGTKSYEVSQKGA